MLIETIDYAELVLVQVISFLLEYSGISETIYALIQILISWQDVFFLSKITTADISVSGCLFFLFIGVIGDYELPPNQKYQGVILVEILKKRV